MLCIFSVAFAAGAMVESKIPVIEKDSAGEQKLSPIRNDLDYFEELQRIENSEKGSEKYSPASRVKIEDVSVYEDEVVIKIKNPQWAVFTDTNSMDPVLDSGSKAIQIVPNSPEELKEGDIVAYKSEYKEGTIAHRIIETGYDKDGWFAVIKGDNNESPDPGKVRFEQIKRVVVAIIY